MHFQDAAYTVVLHSTCKLTLILSAQYQDACKVVRIVGLPHSTTLEDVETMLSEFSVSPGGIKLHFQRDGSFFGQVMTLATQPSPNHSVCSAHA